MEKSLTSIEYLSLSWWDEVHSKREVELVLCVDTNTQEKLICVDELCLTVDEWKTLINTLEVRVLDDPDDYIGKNLLVTHG